MNHIKSTNDDNSWCGKSLGIDFHFKDAEQAALNGLHGSKSMCIECIEKVIECLRKNNLIQPE
jgi:hypothetical protein